MAEKLTPEQWAQIHTQLNDRDDAHYGLPRRTSDSVPFVSWDLVKFGSEFDKDRQPQRSVGAYELIADFCSRCDLISIQEPQHNLWSVHWLRDRLNVLRPQSHYRFLSSDITGREPNDREGIYERMVFLYDETKFSLGEIASDVTLDRPTITDNVNKAIETYRAELGVLRAEEGFQAQFMEWMKSFNPFKRNRLPNFFLFARAPHLVTFRIAGEAGHHYDLTAVNAHVTYDGHDANQREWEFFALLHWLVNRQSFSTMPETPVTILLGDLNLDFDSDNDKRRAAVEGSTQKMRVYLFPVLQHTSKPHHSLRYQCAPERDFYQVSLMMTDAFIPGI